MANGNTWAWSTTRLPGNPNRRVPPAVLLSGLPHGSLPCRDPLPCWPSQSDGDPGTPGPGTVRVLLIDDNPRARAGIRALLLTTPGVRVVGEAANGEEGLRLAASLQPAAVVMDINLPGLDGVDAVRVLKSRQPAIRLVVLTMSAARRAQALAAGADAFLVKGGPAGELVEAVLGTDDPGPGAGRGKHTVPPPQSSPAHNPSGQCFGMPVA